MMKLQVLRGRLLFWSRVKNEVSNSQGIVSMPKVIIDYNEKDKEMIQADIIAAKIS